MEQEVGQGDTEVTGELTTVSSSNNTNPFFEEVGKNPFLEDDKNPFHNNNDDDDDDDDKNPFKESKSTNPFDEDEGKSGPKQKLINIKLSLDAFLLLHLWCVIQLFNFRTSGIIITWFKQLKVSQGMCIQSFSFWLGWCMS